MAKVATTLGIFQYHLLRLIERAEILRFALHDVNSKYRDRILNALRTLEREGFITLEENGDGVIIARKKDWWSKTKISALVGGFRVRVRVYKAYNYTCKSIIK